MKECAHSYHVYIYRYPKVEWKGLTTFAMRSNACVFLLLHLLKLGMLPEIPIQHSETRIITRDSNSNRLKSEDTENTDPVY